MIFRCRFAFTSFPRKMHGSRIVNWFENVLYANIAQCILITEFCAFVWDLGNIYYNHLLPIYQPCYSNIKHWFDEIKENTKFEKFLKRCDTVHEWLWIPDITCIWEVCVYFWWKWTCFKYSSFIIIEFRHWEEIYCYTKNGWLLYRRNKI